MPMIKKLVFVGVLFMGFFPVIAQAEENPLLNEEFWKTATVQVVVKILDVGADVEARDGHGWTPLHAAAENSKTTEAVELLLNRGANAKVTTNDGTTPFHLAKENKHLKGTDVYWRINEAQYR